MTLPETVETDTADTTETEAPTTEEPKKLRLEPTRYGDWELNGKCVDF